MKEMYKHLNIYNTPKSMNYVLTIIVMMYMFQIQMRKKKLTPHPHSHPHRCVWEWVRVRSGVACRYKGDVYVVFIH